MTNQVQQVRLSLALAERIVDAALENGRELGLKPLSVAVLDAGGHLVSFRRQDGASTLRPQIATGKASSALALGMSSRKLADMGSEGRASLLRSAPLLRTGSSRRPAAC